MEIMSFECKMSIIKPILIWTLLSWIAKSATYEKTLCLLSNKLKNYHKGHKKQTKKEKNKQATHTHTTQHTLTSNGKHWMMILKLVNI